MISGFANIFLIKAGKKLEKKHKAWVGMLHMKFLLAIIFVTPILKHLIAIIIKEEVKLKQVTECTQAYFCLGMYVYSTGVKYFREEVCKNFESSEDAKLAEKLAKANNKV